MKPTGDYVLIQESMYETSFGTLKTIIVNILNINL